MEVDDSFCAASARRVPPLGYISRLLLPRALSLLCGGSRPGGPAGRSPKKHARGQPRTEERDADDGWFGLVRRRGSHLLPLYYCYECGVLVSLSVSASLTWARYILYLTSSDQARPSDFFSFLHIKKKSWEFLRFVSLSDRGMEKYSGYGSSSTTTVVQNPAFSPLCNRIG